MQAMEALNTKAPYLMLTAARIGAAFGDICTITILPTS